MVVKVTNYWDEEVELNEDNIISLKTDGKSHMVEYRYDRFVEKAYITLSDYYALQEVLLGTKEVKPNGRKKRVWLH